MTGVTSYLCSGTSNCAHSHSQYCVYTVLNHINCKLRGCSWFVRLQDMDQSKSWLWLMPKLDDPTARSLSALLPKYWFAVVITSVSANVYMKVRCPKRWGNIVHALPHLYLKAISFVLGESCEGGRCCSQLTAMLPIRVKSTLHAIETLDAQTAVLWKWCLYLH